MRLLLSSLLILLIAATSPCRAEITVQLRGFPAPPPDPVVISGVYTGIEAEVTSTDFPISRVEFCLSGYLFRTETIPPYAMNGDDHGRFIPWDTTIYPNGIYWVRATAFDTQGNTGVKGLTFRIFNNTPPTASCSADKTAGSLPFTVNFTGMALDPDGQVLTYFWDFGDNTTSTERSPTHTYTVPGVYKVLFRVSDGMVDATDRIGIRAGMLPYVETNGLVSMEAEDYDQWFDGNSLDEWRISAGRPNYSGTGFVQHVPDAGLRYVDSSGPRVEYRIDFLHTGTYSIWLRGYALLGGASCRVAMNGTTVCDNVTWQTFNSWRWTSVSGAGARVSAGVSATGVNILSIGGGEDGLLIDKIVLTTDPAYTPNDAGPAASARALRRSSVTGDADMDGRVNILDLIFIRNRLSHDVDVSNNRWADLTGDNRIDILDLIYCRNHLGQTP